VKVSKIEKLRIVPIDHPDYKWYVLVLTALTGTFALAAPGLSMSVLFTEISSDLHLNVGQVGWIWGIGALPGILTSLLGGAITDRFGPKRVIQGSIFLLGIFIALRGITGDFASLMVVALLVGAFSPLISTCAIKICGLWFPRRQFGRANGIFTLGMAFGFLLGSLVSATLLSPLLGGWRHVMFMYGALCLLLLIPWHFTRANPSKIVVPGQVEIPSVPVRQAMAHIIKIKNIWLLGVAMMGLSGCMQSMTGYLPLYLKGEGWAGTSADGALALLNAMSMTFVLPLTLGSDKLKVRKLPLLGMFLMIITGNALLTFINGWGVWFAVSLAGAVRDASMALIFTMAVECEGVGPVYAGTATGFIVLFTNLGAFFAPPAGNQLAGIFSRLPFAFWAGLAALGFASLALVKSPKRNLIQVEPYYAESEV
jgi:MFS family permease